MSPPESVMVIHLLLSALLQGAVVELPECDFGGVTLAQLCAEVKTISQVNVTVQPDLSREIVIIKSPRMRLNSFLEKVSAICDARVEQRSDGPHIVRSPDLSRRLRTEYLEHRSQRIKMAIDQWKVVDAGADNPERQAAFLVEDFKSRAGGTTVAGTPPTPTALLLRNLVVSIGATKLASVLPSTVQVLSNSPSASEIALPNVSRLLREYQERQLAILNLIPDQAPVQGASPAENEAISSSWNRIKAEVKSAARATTILVDCVASYDYLLVAVSLFGDRGEQVARVGHRLDLAPLSTTPAPEWESSLGKVTISPTTSTMITLPWTISSAIPFDFARTDTLAISEMLLNPDRDPFASHVAASMSAWSKRDRLAVFMRPADAVLEARPHWISGNQADLFLFSKALRDTRHQIKLVDDTVLIWPTDPVEAEMKRVPRAALTNLLRSCKSEGHLSLQTYSRFCYESYGSASRGLLERARALLPALGVPKESSLYPFTGSGYVYSILGGLRSSEWQRLTRGVALPWASLDGIQRRALSNWFLLRVADSTSRLSILQRRGSRAFATSNVLTANAVRSERTAARLAKPGGGFFADYPFARSATQIASQIAYSVGTGEYSSIEAALAGDWIMASQEVIELILQGDEMRIADTVDGPTKHLVSSAAQPYAKLPETFRNEVEHAVRNFGKE
jgi:hypothetical protein